MINSIRANQPTFEPIEFKPGFNVVLADRTLDSTRKDSRNGLGKTTLIEIIHFGLASAPTRGKGLLSPSLENWEFSLDLTLPSGRRVLISRNTRKPSQIFLEGDLSGWPVTAEKQTGRQSISATDWRAVLGEEMFALSSHVEPDQYSPSFRSLISYFARRGPDAFSSPFEHHRKQSEWDKQISNAFLLGLSWRDASAFQILKDRENALSALQKAASTGAVAGLEKTPGELEAERVTLEDRVRRSAGALESFRVHPQYAEIQGRANRLTASIHKITNENVGDTRVLEFYESSIKGVRETDQADIARVYEEAGVILGESVKRRFEDVRSFHETLISNRAAFLQAEIGAIKRRIEARDAERARLVEERAVDLETLRTHGALEEYTRLQQDYLTKVAVLKDLDIRLQNARKIAEGKSAIRIEREVLLQRARRNYDDRREQRQLAIHLFDQHAQVLYQSAGTLVIDITATGFRFNVEVERSASHGVSNMKIYCYDMTLAELWSGAIGQHGPGFLVHDSTIYEGVDERQVAIGLEHAAQVCERQGFQYICALNSDSIPISEFSDGFDLNHFVRRRLTDERIDGSLLGIRF